MGEPIKIVLTGSCGTGKTSIINRLVFDNFEEEYITTEGGACGQKTFVYPERSLSMDVWDTAGQEKYKALTKIFYKDASIAILVYDITRRETFDELKNYWIKQLTQFAKPGLILGVAGNKSDKFAQEQVSEEEASKFAKEIGAVFGLTSAFLNTGINELFKELGRKYLNPEHKNVENRSSIRLNTDSKIQTNANEKKKCCD